MKTFYARFGKILTAVFIFVPVILAGFFLLGRQRLASAAVASSSAQREACRKQAEEIKDKAILDLKDSLKRAPNFLQYTEYKMRKRKYDIGHPLSAECNNLGYSSFDYGSDYGLKPYGRSLLSKEITATAMASDYFLSSGMGQGIDLITGTRAVNESLQLGSIGVDRGTVTQSGANKRNIELALELYYDEAGKYPAKLDELASKGYLGTIPSGFTYKKINDGKYELNQAGESIKKDNYDIGEISSLNIKSHPWQSMIGDKKPVVSEIFSIVPKDDFVIYFKDMDKLTELENAIKSFGKPLQRIYGLSEAVKVKEKIFARLGIKDIKFLRNFIDEAALVSYDLDAYPNTDYALILKIKSSLLDGFVSDYIQTPKDRHGKVGDYYVIATDAGMFDEISKIKNNADMSLKNAKDLSYALSVLEDDRDGFVYFSEDFVKKLTGPAYRINARRRNTVLGALETLQYTVFAYRNIKGSWPSSFDQIVKEGYIQSGSVANMGDYSIGLSGVVRHNVWNTIYDVTPIIRVPIKSVSIAEKNVYDSFKDGYEKYWREFIDPIGVAITIGDQISFHTIILPLIEESQYNSLKDVAGGGPVSFDFIGKPDKIPSFQAVSKFSINDVLYSIYKQGGKYMDEDYQKCRNDYYAEMYKKTPENRSGKTVDEVCKYIEKTRDQAVAAMKKKLSDMIEWDSDKDVLGFVGNEITLAAGDSIVFKENDFSKLDIYLGLKINNVDDAKEFLKHVFGLVSKEMGGRGGRSAGYGFLQFDTTEPIKNTYNETEFYIVPLGFTNVYYTFIGDRFYVTISQVAMNQLIDGHKKNTGQWSNQMARMFDYLGEKHNVMIFADGSKLVPWNKSYIKGQWSSYGGAQSFKEIIGDYAEALALAKNLPDYDGTISNTDRYFHFIPSNWFDASIYGQKGEPYIKVGETAYKAYDIDSGYGRYYYGSQTDKDASAKKTKLSEIVARFDVDKALAEWQSFKDIGAGLTLTKEGLDIKFAFNNPESSKIDSRVAGTSYGGRMSAGLFSSVVSGNTGLIVLGSGVIVFIVIGSILFFALRKRKMDAVLDQAQFGLGQAFNMAQSLKDNSTQQPSPSAPQPETPLPPELIDYVKTMREQGSSDELIRQNLILARWSEEKILRALSGK